MPVVSAHFRSIITIGHLYSFGPLAPPALPGLPMASYATGHCRPVCRKRQERMTRRRSASQRGAVAAWCVAVAARTTMCSCESAEQTGCRPAGSDTSRTYRTCSAHTHTHTQTDNTAPASTLTNNAVVDRRLRPRCGRLSRLMSAFERTLK